MRIATWNLLHGFDLRVGRVDLDGVAAAIDALDVDVIAVQEVDRGQERTGGVDQVAELARRLGWHGVFAPALLGDPGRQWRPGPGAAPDPGGRAYGVGLLSRHALHAVARLTLPGASAGARPAIPTVGPGWDREPRVAVRAEVGSSGLTITTTHLSYLPWRGLCQLRAALRWAGSSGCRSVLLGDLNLPQRALRPVLRAAGWQLAPVGPTFPARRPGLAIDHIVARRGVLREVRVGAGGPSDHLPVVARLAWA